MNTQHVLLQCLLKQSRDSRKRRLGLGFEARMLHYEKQSRDSRKDGEDLHGGAELGERALKQSRDSRKRGGEAPDRLPQRHPSDRSNQEIVERPRPASLR